MEKIECPQCHHKTAAHLNRCNECGYPLKEDKHFERLMLLASTRPSYMSFVSALVTLFLPIRYLDFLMGALTLSLVFTGFKSKKELGFAWSAIIVLLMALLLKILSVQNGFPIYII